MINEGHPGETLKDELEARGLSATRLARRLNVAPSRIIGIVNCKRSITPDTALRLARFFGNSAEFWLGRQMGHDLYIAEREHGARISAEVQPDTDRAA